jgi:hypothetical protein
MLPLTPQQELDNLNDQIKQMRAELGRNPISPFGDLIAARTAFKELSNIIDEIDSTVSRMDNAFDDMVRSLKGININLTDQKSVWSEIKSSTNGIIGISEKISSFAKGDLDLSRKQIIGLTKKQQRLKEHLITSRDINVLDDKALEAADNIIGKLDQQKQLLEDALTLREQINSNASVKGFGFFEDISKSIPGLRTLSEPFQKASAVAKDVARQNINAATTGGEMQSVFKAGAKELLEGFKGAAIWAVVIKQLWDAFIKTDKLAGDMAKSMNMTYSASLSTVTSLTSMANTSGDNFVTTQKLGETLMYINKTLGTSVMLSKEQLVIFTQLREKAGLTNEELMGMSALSLATNQDFTLLTEQFLGQAQITASNNKVLLNSKDLFRSIKDISAATTISLGQNSGKLAEALATTKAMGIEMSKIEGIQNTLMDFESSIENQLAAELLTGRQINLERARGYALNNDIKGLTEEIAKNIGTAADFSKMNLIQQNNLAQAVGMSREELAKSLYIREQLLNVSAKDQALAERVINAKIKEVGLDQAQKELGKESLENMMKQTSMQDRFNASVEKMKELFVGVVEAIMPLVDILMTVVDLAGILMKIIDPFIQALGALGGMVKDFLSPNDPIANHYYNEGLNKMGSSIENNWLNPLGFAGDIISPASGRTTISTKEGGLLRLSPNDDVIAAPGAAKLLNKQPQYAVDMSETNNLLKQLVYKQGTIKIDNTEIGTAFAVNSYNIQ